ncbi:hypothetical protein BDV09DRAFT_164203 [Aspergillus tetrazonus]
MLVGPEGALSQEEARLLAALLAAFPLCFLLVLLALLFWTARTPVCIQCLPWVALESEHPRLRLEASSLP